MICNKDEDKCEFYPSVDDDGCVCDAGSDISGAFICTKKYSESCQWANERREHDPKMVGVYNMRNDAFKELIETVTEDINEVIGLTREFTGNDPESAYYGNIITAKAQELCWWIRIAIDKKNR